MAILDLVEGDADEMRMELLDQRQTLAGGVALPNNAIAALGKHGIQQVARQRACVDNDGLQHE